MGPKIINIKDRLKNKDPNKSKEDVMAELITELAKQIYDLTISQHRLAKVIKNQNVRIDSLSKAVGDVEDQFAEKEIYIGEYSIPDIDLKEERT